MDTIYTKIPCKEFELDELHQYEVGDEDTWVAGETNLAELLVVVSDLVVQSKSANNSLDGTVGESLLSKLEDNASLQATLTKPTEDMVAPEIVIVMEEVVVGLKTFTKLEVEDNLDRET